MTINDAAIQILTALADELLVPVPDLPVPSQTLADGALLHTALDVRSDQRDLVERACRLLAARTPPYARHLFEHDNNAFHAVANLVAGAYLMSAEVRTRIGYPGQARRPAHLEEAADQLSDDILDPVLSRGPIYRPTPDPQD